MTTGSLTTSIETWLVN